MHALQDGFTLGMIFVLSLVYPLAVALMAGVLGLDGIKPRKIIKSADELVRTEDIQDNPEYFVIGLVLGGVVGYAVGKLAIMANLPTAIPF